MFSSFNVILSTLVCSFARTFVYSLIVRLFVCPFVRSCLRLLGSLDRSIFFYQILCKTNHERTTLHCEVDSTAACANFSIISFIRKMFLRLLFVVALFLLALVVDLSSGTFCDQGLPGRYCYKDLTGWYECVYDSKTKTMNQTKHDCPANTRSVGVPKPKTYRTGKVSPGKVTCHALTSRVPLRVHVIG